MKIREVVYETRSVAPMAAFYTDVLEFESIDSGRESFTVQVGRTALTFETAAPGTDPFYHYAIRAAVGNIEVVRDWLAPRVELLADERGRQVVTWEATNNQSVYFFDPAGNLVEFINYLDFDEPAKDEFDATDVGEINEVGLPVPRNPPAVRALETHAGLAPLNDPSDDVVLLGDDDGMFILIETGTEWFMTQKPAEMHPISVTVEGEHSQELTFSELPYALEITSLGSGPER